MPYSGPKDKDIPDNVPEDKKAQWVEIWNNTYSSCISDGGSAKSCETKAFKSANGAIKERSGVMKRGFLGVMNEFVEGIKKVVDTFQERAVSVSSIGNETFEHFYNQGAWLNDLYIENGEIFAVASEGGKLFRASIDITEETGDIVVGEMQEVITKFDAVSRTSFSTTEDGKVRMLAISATSVINKNGAIDSRDLFDSMADYMERTDKKVPRTFFHKGIEFRSGDITHMVRDENVLITVTEFDDSEFARREIEAREKDPEYWGDSIEFNPVGDPEMYDVGDGITIPVYRSGIPIAVSTLPAELACSHYADKFSIKRQEVNRMTLTDVERNALIKQFDGDEEAADKWLEDNVSPVNRAIAEEDLVTRAEDVVEEEPTEDEPVEDEPTDDEPAEEPEVEPEEEPSEEPEEEPEEEPVAEVVLEFDDEMAAQVSDTVLASDGFVEFRDSVLEAVESFKTSLAEIGTTVAELQAVSVSRTKQLAELQKNEDEKRAEWKEDLPRNTNKKRVSFRPRNDGSDEPPEEQSMQAVAAETIAGIAN